MSEATMTADVKTQDGQLEFLVKGITTPRTVPCWASGST